MQSLHFRYPFRSKQQGTNLHHAVTMLLQMILVQKLLSVKILHIEQLAQATLVKLDVIYRPILLTLMHIWKHFNIKMVGKKFDVKYDKNPLLNLGRPIKPVIHLNEHFHLLIHSHDFLFVGEQVETAVCYFCYIFCKLYDLTFSSAIAITANMTLKIEEVGAS